MAFAARAIGSATGSLMEVAAGTAAATHLLHVASSRPTTLVDLAAPMLEVARRNIGKAADGAVPERIAFECRDMLAPTTDVQYQTILGLGILHLVEDVPALIDGLVAQLSPDGTLYLASLIRGSRRSSAYLNLLHRTGQIVEPRTLADLQEEVGRSAARVIQVYNKGSMAYVELPRPAGSRPTPAAEAPTERR